MIYYSKQLLDKLPRLYEMIIDRFKFSSSIKSEYLIQGIITISSYNNKDTYFPDEYKAIMFQINKMKINIKKGKQLNNNRWSDEESKHYSFLFSLNYEDAIKLTDKVYVKQKITTQTSQDLKSSFEKYDLYVYSYKLTFSQLKSQIDIWLKDYTKYKKEYTDGNLYYFSYIGKNKAIKKDDDNNEDERLFENHIFYSNKDFNNIFFEDKKLLLNRINYFLNNQDEYKRLGIPYTLGLLFYGDPGCGKTSTIKAIANYTKRHIIEIPLSKIKTCNELKKIFFAQTINDHYVPSDKKIIVLEDIDCMSNIVHKRKSSHNNFSNKTIDEKIKYIRKSIKKDNQTIDENNIDDIIRKMILAVPDYYFFDELSLSYLLNLIDGVLEQKGRIIIITTNHPDKLDEALIRPGRIDMKINFKKCNNQICKDILEYYYKTTIDMNFDNYKYTPAEVFQACFRSKTIDEAIKLLS
jgi:hypothetical protein